MKRATQSGRRSASSRQPAFRMMAVAVIMLLAAACVRAQTSKFSFDLSGDVLTQTSEAAALPRIIGQPQMQIVAPGESASFSVVLADTRGVTYQWYFNGGLISSATRDSLLLTSVPTNFEGLYSVVVSNASGAVTSSPANLYIDSDGDGLPDSWEIAHFGNLNQTALGDADGDGVSNLQEFLDGTDPTNAASALYRVTLFNDGGIVLVSPNQSAFTKGTTVTLTAIGTNNAPFHAWTGDITSRSTTLTFQITNNTTLYAHFQPLTFTWTNLANGDWNVPANWSPNLVPSTNESVLINNGTIVTENSNVDLLDFTLGSSGNGSGIDGSGRITIAGLGLWDSGYMNGSGTTVILPTATFEIANTFQPAINNRTLENFGLMFWNGGSLLLNGGVVINDEGAQIVLLDSETFINNSGSPRFDNAGSLVTASNAATSFVSLPFNNYGSVTIQGGTFTMSGGGLQGGLMPVLEGTTVNFAGGNFTSTSNLSLIGQGTLLFTGGTETLGGTINVTGSNAFLGGFVDFTGNYTYTNNLLISAGTVNFDGTGTVSPQTLVLTGQSTLGGAQNVTVNNSMTWSGASTMSGSGKTIIPPAAMLTISNSGLLFMNNRTLDNAGTIFWASSQPLELNGGIITNEPGALFQVQSPQTLNNNSGNPRFDNAGTFRVTGSGTMTVTAPLNNYNLVDIQGGTLFLSGGGGNASSIIVPGGTGISFGNGTYTSSVGSSIAGAGALSVVVGPGGSGYQTFAGTVALAGSNAFSGGNTTEFTGNYVCTNNLLISGGTVNFDGTGTVSPQTLVLTGQSTMGGAQNVTVNNSMLWSGASTMSGSGKTIVTPAATLTISNSGLLFLNNRTLDNAGTVFWATDQSLALNGGIITNEPGALFQVQSPQTIYNNSGNPRVDNTGTFRVTGSGTMTVTAPLNNYNLVDIQGGTLFLSGGGVNSNAITVPGGTSISFGSGNYTSSVGSSIAGAGALSVVVGQGGGGSQTFAGTVALAGSNVFNSGSTTEFTGNYICTNNLLISAGTVNFDGTGTVSPQTLVLTGQSTLGGAQNLTVNNSMLWSGASTMSGTGKTIIAPPATLTISFSSLAFMNSRTLDNAGTVFWPAGSGLDLNGGIITNEPGALFQVESPQTIDNNSGNPRFDNAGTFRAVGSGVITFAGLPLNNYGTLDLQNGGVSASGGYVCASNSVLNCALWGTVPGATFSQLHASGTLNVKGSLNVHLTNYYVPKTNDSFAVLTAGSVSGAFASFAYPSNNLTMTLTNTPASEVVQVTAVSLTQSNSVLAPAGMISWWRGENNANDSTGTNNGTITNNVSYAAGEVGQSFLLDGSSGCIYIPDSASLRPASVTVEAWVKIFSTNSTQLIFAKPLGTNTLDSYGLAIQNGILLAAICDTNGFGAFLSDVNVLSLGQWHHTAFTFDATTGMQALYTDGAMVASGAAGKSMQFDNHPLLLGADIENAVPSYFLNGQIDEASIYGRALTADEIGSIYNVGVGGKQAVPAPILHIEVIAPLTVRIYWSTSLPGYHLEYNNAANTTNWAASGATLAIVGTNYVVTNSLSNIRRFYRLSSVAAPYTPSPPMLKIQLVSPSSVQLSWPIDADRLFYLQSATNLTNWILVATPSSTLGSNNVVTNTITGTRQFYRLSNH